MMLFYSRATKANHSMKILNPFLLVMLLSLFSCLDKEADPSPKEFITGSWGYSSIVYNGKPIPLGFSEEYNIRWVFNSDGTYYKKLSYYSDNPMSFSEGTWQIRDNASKLVLKDARFGHEVVWDLLEVKDDYLKIKITSISKFEINPIIAEIDMIHVD